MRKKRCAGLAVLLLALCLPLLAAAQELDAAQWLEELKSFVGETGCRESYTPGEEQACQWLARRFQQMGYSREDGTLLLQQVPTEVEYLVEYGWEDGAVNVIASKRAAGEAPGILIVSGHYDTFWDTVGAKDNGSGMAAVLTLARRYAAREAYPDTELRFIAFSGEERGQIGADHYAYDLSREEQERVIGVINVDLITLDEGAENIALSCNTLGGQSPQGYQEGSRAVPVHNRISRAFEKALFEVGGYAPQDLGMGFCVPRHWGSGDHIPFHDVGIDAATVCFQGNLQEGGSWPADMHTPADALKPFDMERTEQALQVIDHMVDGLAKDHDYGQ